MSEPGKLQRWVLLFHQAGSGLGSGLGSGRGRSDHWDLLIQNGGELDAWALNANPLEQSDCEGIRLPPHPLKYLDWEGELTGNRGTIRRMAEGNLLVDTRNVDGCGRYGLERESMAAGPVMIEVSSRDKSALDVALGDSVRVEVID